MFLHKKYHILSVSGSNKRERDNFIEMVVCKKCCNIFLDIQSPAYMEIFKHSLQMLIKKLNDWLSEMKMGLVKFN